MGNISKYWSFSCYKCNTPVDDIELKLGEMIVYRCGTCNETLSVMIVPAFPRVSIEGQFKVILRWKDTNPSANELKALRLLLPTYQQMSIVDLKKQLYGKRDLEINNLDYDDAKELISKAQTLGLHVVNEIGNLYKILQEFETTENISASCLLCSGKLLGYKAEGLRRIWCQNNDFKVTLGYIEEDIKTFIAIKA